MSKQEWISVETELPQTKKMVAVLINGNIRSVGNYCIEDKKWRAKDLMLREVTHWMPLPPNPPQGSDK